MHGPLLPPCDEGLLEAAATPTSPLSAGRKRLVLAATVLGSSMAFIDGSALGVALPAIQADLGAGPAATQWIVNAYLLALSALVLVGGAAGDRFGRRRLFVLGVLLFTSGSIACALAPTVSLLVGARASQGVGAAMLTPASLALLGATFPENERARAFGAWAGFGSLTAMLGPVLGGWLVDVASWRAIFWINVPLAVLAVGLAVRFVPESRDERAAGLDVWGAMTAAAGLAGVTWALTAAPDRGFADPTVVTAFVVGVLLLVGFVLLEARNPDAMMPLRLYRAAAFTGTNLLTLLLYFALGGALFFLPFDLIRVQGWSATEAGAALLPFSVVMGLFSGLAGRLADRLGARLPLTIGPVLAGVGLWMLGLPEPGAGYVDGPLAGMVVLGIGMTLAVGPLTATVMGAVEPRHIGVASGINNAVARAAGLLAVAVLGIVLSSAFSAAWQAPDARRALSEVMAGSEGMAGDLTGTAGRDAFHHAFRRVMDVCAASAVLGGVAAFLTVPGGAPVKSPGSSAPSPARSPAGRPSPPSRTT